MSVTPRVELVGEQSPARIYFHATDGTVWRIYDRSFGPPHAKPYRHHTFASVGDPRATMRWFQGRDGSARLYRFAKGEHRLADAATLEQQLLRAQYPATAISADEALEGYQRMLAASRKKELDGGATRHVG